MWKFQLHLGFLLINFSLKQEFLEYVLNRSLIKVSSLNIISYIIFKFLTASVSYFRIIPGSLMKKLLIFISKLIKTFTNFCFGMCTNFLIIFISLKINNDLFILFYLCLDSKMLCV